MVEKIRYWKLASAVCSVLAVMWPLFLTADTAETSISELEPTQMPAHLYFAAEDHSFLMAEQRELGTITDPVKKGKAILNALIEGPKQHLMRTVPKETILKAFFISNDDTAYVDFSEAIREHHPGGCRLEQFTLYSIVNSLVLNLDQVRAVKILINGREAQTLAGHIDIRFPLSANMLIIR